MVHFLAEVLLELPVKGRVVSVEVEDASYRVTLALSDQGHRTQVHQLSAYDVSRSMRGDQDALAAIRADFLRQNGGVPWRNEESDAGTR